MSLMEAAHYSHKLWRSLNETPQSPRLMTTTSAFPNAVIKQLCGSLNRGHAVSGGRDHERLAQAQASVEHNMPQRPPPSFEACCVPLPAPGSRWGFLPMPFAPQPHCRPGGPIPEMAPFWEFLQWIVAIPKLYSLSRGYHAAYGFWGWSSPWIPSTLTTVV